MKVKVKDTIYDGNIEPVMIILSKADKRNIANMPADKTRYCSFPKGMARQYNIHQWMREDME